MVIETDEYMIDGCKVVLNNYYKTDDPEERIKKFTNIILENFCRTMSNEYVTYYIKKKEED